MLKRLLITGAGGKLGSMLRGRLGHVAETIRLSDVVDLGEAAPMRSFFAAGSKTKRRFMNW